MHVKSALRKELLSIMRSIPREDRSRTDTAICARILSTDVYECADVLFLFIGLEWEVNLSSLLKRALADGKTVLCPVARKKGIMEALRVERPEDLHRSEGGLIEPAAHCPPARPEAIDLTLAPCLSCDPFGVRIGYGGGYYDRYLPLLRADAINLTVLRECQFSIHLPGEVHDVPVDGYITETGVFRAAPASL